MCAGRRSSCKRARHERNMLAAQKRTAAATAAAPSASILAPHPCIAANGPGFYSSIPHSPLPKFVFHLHNMFKTFAHCSLSDLEHEISASASASSARALDSYSAQLVLHPFIERFTAHPALSLACPDPAFVAELTAHALYCRASRSSVQRWQVMFRCRTPSQAHAQQRHVYGIDIGLKQRSTLLARAALCELLVLRLMRFGGACHVRPAASRDTRCVAAPFPRVEKPCVIPVR